MIYISITHSLQIYKYLKAIFLSLSLSPPLFLFHSIFECNGDPILRMENLKTGVFVTLLKDKSKVSAVAERCPFL